MKTQKFLIAFLFASALFASSCKNDNAPADPIPVAEAATPVATDTAATAASAMNTAKSTANNEKKGEKNDNETEEANED